MLCKLSGETAEAKHGVNTGCCCGCKDWKLLGERLLFKGIPAVSVSMSRDQKYHGKVKAVIDSLRDAGVKLL